jgi:hypothetical protein
MAIDTSPASFPVLDDSTWADTYNLISICAWVVPGASGRGDIWFKNREFRFSVVGTDGVDMRLQYFSDHTGGGSADGTWESSDNSLAIGTPAHVAVVHDRDNAGAAVLYVNGVADTIQIAAAAGNKRTSNNYHRILNDWAGNNPLFGEFADIRLFDRLLSAEEVEAIAVSGGGDPVYDANMQLRLTLDEREPGVSAVSADVTDISDFDRTITVTSGGGTIDYIEDPFGFYARSRRRLVG